VTVLKQGGCPPWPVPNCDGGDACWDECEHWEEFVAFGLAEADAIDDREDIAPGDRHYHRGGR
jgi:hypothetical protein